MKKIYLLFLFSFFAVLSKAQEGILFTDYEPDLCLSALQFINPQDTLKIDLDQDGTIDFEIWFQFVSSGDPRVIIMHSSWEYRIQKENDSIISSVLFEGDWQAPRQWWLDFPQSSTPTPINEVESVIGFRKTINNQNYYAWAKVYAIRDDHYSYDPAHQGQFLKMWVYVDKHAYCTIPDFALGWGQTDFDWDVEENQNMVVATIHPNPSSGMVIITGEDLKEAVVFNSIGQKVATAKGEGGQLSIDLTKTTSGIYFVSITAKNGKKGMKKVVKR